MLNRELECRLSFLISGPWTVPVVSFVLLSGVVGGGPDSEFVLGWKDKKHQFNKCVHIKD